MLIANPAVGSSSTAQVTVNLQIGLVGGTKAPGRIIVDVEDDGQGSTINKFSPTGPTLQGHPGAAGAAAVGAAFYFDTPRCGTTPPTLESYSSAGGAPILFDAFERLGRSIEPISAPKGVLKASVTADLPPPLRRLRQDAPKTFAASETAQLKIAFPPDGARIDLGLKDGAPDQALALKALGGAPPFTWFVNGAPVGEAEIRRQSAWKPDGAGFARVSVTDAKGASDAVTVRLE